MRWLTLEPFHVTWMFLSLFEAGKEKERKMGGHFMRTCQWDKYERAELMTFLQPLSYFGGSVLSPQVKAGELPLVPT